MISLKQTPVNVSKDHNGVSGSLLYDSTGNVITTFYHCSAEEKDEIVKRINDFPKLVKMAIELVDIIGEDYHEVSQLRNFIHNYSRKEIKKNDYK